MDRGDFLKKLGLMVGAGAAGAAAQEVVSEEQPKQELLLARSEVIVPVAFLRDGVDVYGEVVFSPDGEVLRNEAGLSSYECGTLWRNARALRRSYEPKLGRIS